MALKLAFSERFWEVVKAEVTQEDGSHTTVGFKAQFLRMKIGEAQALRRSVAGDDDADLQFLQKVCVGLGTGEHGVQDADGTELQFSNESLAKLYQAGFGPAMVTAFFGGLPKAKEKN